MDSLPHVIDVTTETFETEVLQRSLQTPVLVDFWATWCGPCKSLGPVLEKLAGEYGGAFVLAKVDVDKEQQIAAAFQIRSVPSVFLLVGGQPVDAFQGALPQRQIKQFVDKLLALSGDDGGLGEALEAAETMLAKGAFDDAAETFEAIIGEEPENAEAWGGLIRSQMAGGKADEAAASLEKVPAAITGAAPVEAARAQLALARQAANAGPLDELRAKVDADPADQQARFDYATALHAGGQVEDAVDQLLEAFRRDREWNDGAAKAQLFTIFDALTATDPIAQKGRRKLSSLIYA